MRKVYSRPVLVYEDFTLMDAITSNCGVTEGTHENGNVCTWEFEDFGVVVFNTSMLTACDYDYSAVEVLNPELAVSNVFAS